MKCPRRLLIWIPTNSSLVPLKETYARKTSHFTTRLARVTLRDLNCRKYFKVSNFSLNRINHPLFVNLLIKIVITLSDVFSPQLYYLSVIYLVEYLYFNSILDCVVYKFPYINWKVYLIGLSKSILKIKPQELLKQ